MRLLIVLAQLAGHRCRHFLAPGRLTSPHKSATIPQLHPEMTNELSRRKSHERGLSNHYQSHTTP
jgi:hypothetical protein